MLSISIYTDSSCIFVLLYTIYFCLFITSSNITAGFIFSPKDNLNDFESVVCFEIVDFIDDCEEEILNEIEDSLSSISLNSLNLSISGKFLNLY